MSHWVFIIRTIIPPFAIVLLIKNGFLAVFGYKQVYTFLYLFYISIRYRFHLESADSDRQPPLDRNLVRIIQDIPTKTENIYLLTASIQVFMSISIRVPFLKLRRLL